EASWFLNMVKNMNMWDLLKGRAKDYINIIDSDVSFCRRFDLVENYIMLFLKELEIKIEDRGELSSASAKKMRKPLENEDPQTCIKENTKDDDDRCRSLLFYSSEKPIDKQDRYTREIDFKSMLGVNYTSKANVKLINLVREEVKRYAKIINYLRDSIITYIKVCEVEVPNNNFLSMVICDTNPQKGKSRELPFFYIISRYNEMYGVGAMLDYIYPLVNGSQSTQAQEKSLAWIHQCKETDVYKRQEEIQKKIQALGYYVYQQRADTAAPIYLSMFNQISDKNTLFSLLFLHPDLIKLYIDYRKTLNKYEKAKEGYKKDLRFYSQDPVNPHRELSKDDKMQVSFANYKNISDIKDKEFVPQSWECPLPKEVFNIPIITKSLQKKAHSLGRDASIITAARVIRYYKLYRLVELTSDGYSSSDSLDSSDSSNSSDFLNSSSNLLEHSSNPLPIDYPKKEISEDLKPDGQTVALYNFSSAEAFSEDKYSLKESMQEKEKLDKVLKGLVANEGENLQYNDIFTLVINNSEALQKFINTLLDPNINYKFHSPLLFNISKFTGKIEDIIDVRNTIIHSLHTSGVCYKIMSEFLSVSKDAASNPALAEALKYAEENNPEKQKEIRDCLTSFMLTPQIEEKIFFFLSAIHKKRSSYSSPYFFSEMWPSSSEKDVKSIEESTRIPICVN
ncbi:hypothetical protein NEFER01_2037, partial [Nematocida sp. LUAm1]